MYILMLKLMYLKKKDTSLAFNWKLIAKFRWHKGIYINKKNNMQFNNSNYIYNFSWLIVWICTSLETSIRGVEVHAEKFLHVTLLVT